MTEKLMLEMYELEEVVAITLGGSRGRNNHDEMSDYDFYIYLSNELPLDKRKAVIEKYTSYMEYGNHFWELEDDGVLNNGIEIEFIYRNLSEFTTAIEQTTNNLIVNHGYSTSFLENLINSVIIFDKTGELTALVEKHSSKMSDELQKAILDYNTPLLLDKIPALYKQVKKAVERQDLNSINHRLTEYFAIFYDVLFAINKTLHPGEKRMLKFALELEKQPKDLENLVNTIFLNVYHDNDKMLRSLKCLSENILELL